MNIDQICKQTKKGRSTVLRTIYWYLGHPPKPNSTPNSNCHLVIDGTWFKKDNCLLVYWDYDYKKVQWWHYTSGESKEVIVKDLKQLKKKEVVPVSVTSDGSTGIKSAVNIVYPNIPHQRCLVHLQRSSLSLITGNPRTKAGIEIRQIVQIISQINLKERKDKWIKVYKHWCNKWEGFLKERTYKEDVGGNWWYTLIHLSFLSFKFI
jgi:hypothetical protein